MNTIGNVISPNTTIAIDGNKIALSQGADQPLDLRMGSTIQGTVMSIVNGEGGKIANISVGDNVISAKIFDEMSLREGQTLNFSVKTSSTNGISLMPLYENVSADNSILKALTAAGIEVNNDTVSMVKDMMEASLPINKENLLEMNRNLSAHPDTSISTLVEMKSLNIPIDDNNIAQYQSYKNYEHQVTNAMESIMDELPNAFSELSSSGNTTAALNLYGSVLKLFGSEIETAAVNKMPASFNDAVIDDQQGKNPKVQNNNLLENSLEEVAELPQQTKETALSGEFVNSLKNLGVSDEAIKKYEAALNEINSKPDNPDAVKPENTKLEIAQKELLKELADTFEGSDISNAVESASWKKVFSSPEYNKLLKDNISSQWLLKPGDVQDKRNIENLYQRLGNQVKGLTNAINSSLGAETRLGQAANNLSNNLDFMNQLNQMFQYVQLPLQMTGQNVHGDLYVYRNKHKKMSEDGSVSAVLHLDMDNLGPVDVYVKMIDTKVTTNFYVEDDSVLQLINDNIHILDARLQKRGYSMNVNLMLHDEMSGQDAAIDEMLDVMKTPVLSTTSFDARA